MTPQTATPVAPHVARGRYEGAGYYVARPAPCSSGPVLPCSASTERTNDQDVEKLPRRLSSRRFVVGVLDDELLIRGLTIAEFQKQTRLARSTIERARRGADLTPRTIRLIADVLDVTPVRATVLRLLGRDVDGVQQLRPYGLEDVR